ncbi:phage tail sheath subtilisin-like domain-containing protein [Thiotrichales bacterium 19S3-7]|nr:phage tail sheath subtilisin-like domain-containing protein [Thiotrichales bacterium 19S3-7]MCF6801284.1 phage tail sheath subtilisin-like domain-containing protein [Thiotrichales bacterium 19S3-11]
MSDSFFHGVEIIESNDGIRPIQTIRSSVIGLVGIADDADPELFPVNEPTLITNRKDAAKLGSNGTLVDAVNLIYDQVGALIVIIRVKKEEDDNQQIATILGGVDENEKRTGIHALLDAESKLGVKPKLLIVPGFSSEAGVVNQLVAVAEKLKAIIIAETPSTTDTQAIEYLKNFDHARIYAVDPDVYILKQGEKVIVPCSGLIAGLIAKVDHRFGWHVSPSNHTLNGITGTQRAIEYSYAEESRANVLNENRINVIIRQNGWRLWGNRTTTSDSKWQFLCIRRTADMINESLLYAHQWAVDRGITKTFIDDVTMSVNSYLRTLTAQGRIIGGKCWVDQTINSNSQILNGHIIFDFDFTPVYPAERITFRSKLTDEYLEEIF